MHRLLVVLGLLIVVSDVVADDDWHPVGTYDGVVVEAAKGRTGFDAHRASVVVCTNLDEISAFIADADNFHKWIAFTQEARLLEEDGERTLYYHRSSAPWPVRDRDMVYELQPHFDKAGNLHIRMTGLPNFLPVQQGVVRMQMVDGEWLFSADHGEVRVQLTVDADPGHIARFLANRRLAATVGYTLANLAKQFPCSAPLPSG
jgi:hypothetical protein